MDQKNLQKLLVNYCTIHYLNGFDVSVKLMWKQSETSEIAQTKIRKVFTKQDDDGVGTASS